VHYIKPLQTGATANTQGDADFVKKHTSNHENLTCDTLFCWETPASPHMACQIEDKPLTEEELYDRLYQVLQANLLATQSASASSFIPQQSTLRKVTLIETAGGPLSPGPASKAQSASSWSWRTQADIYQPLVGRLPVILAGDGCLGGIHSTLSTMESLLLRGYEIAAIVMIQQQDDYNYTQSNIQALQEYLSKAPTMLRTGTGESLSTLSDSIVCLPPIPADPTVPLFDWYADTRVQSVLDRLDAYLESSWQGQVQDWQSMASTSRKVFWWPFTQHSHVKSDDQVTLVNSACGDYYQVLRRPVEEKQDKDTDAAHSSQQQKQQRQQQDRSNSQSTFEHVPLFDACASWWTQGVGHGSSSAALTVAATAGRYGHVIFPQVVHAPALNLAHALLSGVGKDWAKRVFWTDNGSTSLEVAIKMGLRTFAERRKRDDEKGEESESHSDHDDADDHHGHAHGHSHSHERRRSRPRAADGREKKPIVCGQEGCYHGDTLGAMSVAEPNVFNQGQHPWYEPKGLTLTPPTIAFCNGQLRIQFPEGSEPSEDTVTMFDSISQVMDVDARIMSRKLFSQYKELIDMQWTVYEHMTKNEEVATVVIEPVLMGAGGMKFVDPLWQRALMDIATMRDVPVIFDEVASGLYRVGVMSCREILRKDPDIACYAKLLTGGLMPLSVVLTTEEVYEAFLGEEKSQALLHGHSYAANPMGCVSALHALETYQSVLVQEGVKQRRPLMWFDEAQVKNLSMHPLVEQCFTLGTVLAVTVKPDVGAGGYGATSRAVPIVEELRQRSVYARPLGNVVYIMASPLTSRTECQRLLDKLRDVIDFVAKSTTQKDFPQYVV
jgi:bifunctional dethiobiotin synthetase / adenosylmethionine---8-amino-7-oxononanoate aminotransferase